MEATLSSWLLPLLIRQDSARTQVPTPALPTSRLDLLQASSATTLSRPGRLASPIVLTASHSILPSFLKDFHPETS